ncbi:MAG: hypothetical protein R6U20_01265 [Longimonas sp.]|uniref:hypothetical protein n=1 Tax=Longimonas sp. TaxID=2039626 RepID=UPI0039768BF2
MATLAVAALLLVGGPTAAASPASPHSAPAALADTTNHPPPPDYGDHECADNLAGCAVGVALYTLFAPAFNALFSDARIAAAGGSAAALSLRVGRTLRYDSGASPAVFPYVAVGMRSQQLAQPDPALHVERVFLETAVGLRSPVHTWTPGGADWLHRIRLDAEAQWLHRGSTHDHLWLEAAPGLMTTSGASTRLVLAPTLSVALAGPRQGLVRPGLTLGVHW